VRLAVQKAVFSELSYSKTPRKMIFTKGLQKNGEKVLRNLKKYAKLLRLF